MSTATHLLDHIDCNFLQNLQDSFAKSIGATVVVVDPRGNPITVPSRGAALRECSGSGKTDAATDAALAFRPEISPAAAMIFVAGDLLGRWLTGDPFPQTVPPDTQSLIFMPMEKDREMAGALGFERETIRDWPPEALAHWYDLAGALAEHLDVDITGRKWRFSSGFGPIYGKHRLRSEMTA